jgi:hypothetical protein
MKIVFLTEQGPEEVPVPNPDQEQSLAPVEKISIDTQQAKQLIKDTKGKIFTVTFIKRTDGSVRVMNARLGVKAYLKGGTLPYNPEEKGLIPVFDIQKRSYRMISLDSILVLKTGNKEYEIKDNIKEHDLSLEEILQSLEKDKKAK